MSIMTVNVCTRFSQCCIAVNATTAASWPESWWVYYVYLIFSEISIRWNRKKAHSYYDLSRILFVALGVPSMRYLAIYLIHFSLRRWNLICSRNDVASDNDSQIGITTERVVWQDRPYRFLLASIWLTRACSPLSYNAPIILERSWERCNNSVITSGTSPEEIVRTIANGRITDKRDTARTIPIIFRSNTYLAI